ncbi:MAG: GGDEF domain-containing protein [Arenimonas sp.]|uniref:GGDEF domain-containing protein n=1 Tax=Arenimonas sp. TaxID=1872635 RepID=UPI0025C22458|nr:GGDEF domain-containing protein [Arenimonas sp.]MBW8368386.1 GGDEF domain-containing protein [Arenimonas sp.]
MVVGVLLSLLTVVLLAQVGRSFPVGRRRPLRIWTVGLMLQPIGWLLLAMRGVVPPVLSISLGNALLLLGFAEMCRAVRSFHGLPERRWLWWGVVAAATAALLVFAGPYPNYSARVLVNSAAAIVLTSGLALALSPSLDRVGFSAARLTAAFAVLGVLTAVWRFVEHSLAPRANGSLFDAGPSDMAVFMYACVGATFLSLGFVLMHTERAYEELRRLASQDALTGVLARGALDERGHALASESRRLSQPLAVLLLDLDQFTAVNDRLGHEAGDCMLRHLAARARLVLRGEDLLCRMGGDEFVMVLPNTDIQGAHIVASRLRGSLAAVPLRFRGDELPIPLSIGVAASAGPDADLTALITRADQAMYVAKRAGGDRIQAA